MLKESYQACPYAVLNDFLYCKAFVERRLVFNSKCSRAVKTVNKCGNVVNKK